MPWVKPPKIGDLKYLNGYCNQGVFLVWSKSGNAGVPLHWYTYPRDYLEVGRPLGSAKSMPWVKPLKIGDLKYLYGYCNQGVFSVRSKSGNAGVPLHWYTYP